MKTTVRVKLRPSSAAARPGSVVYQVARRGERRQMAAPYRLFPAEWDADAGQPLAPLHSGRREEVEQARQGIRRDMERLQSVIEACGRQGAGFTAGDVVEAFRRSLCRRSFLAFMEETVQGMAARCRYGTAHNYGSALRKFRRFTGGADVTFDQMDSRLMIDYEEHLRAGGAMDNSVSFHTRILRAVYNRAVRQGLTEDCRPFRHVFTGVAKTRKRALTFEDIRRIRRLDLSRSPRLDFARDLFIFLFLCRGMSFVDAAGLKKTDLCDGVITYRRQKTGQTLCVRYVEEIRAIVDRHADPRSPYLLPVVSPAKGSVRRQYETMLRLTNSRLKKVALKAGLAKPLTTAVARHSWATIAKRRQVPFPVISDALGHSSLKTTQIYLASVDASDIDKANELVIRDL